MMHELAVRSRPVSGARAREGLPALVHSHDRGRQGNTETAADAFVAIDIDRHTPSRKDPARLLEHSVKILKRQ